MTPSHSVSIRFVALVALLFSLVAMSIDSMLPALAQIAGELNAYSPNSRQHVFTAFFAGLTVGQLILFLGDWRILFLVLVGMALLALLWISVGQRDLDREQTRGVLVRADRRRHSRNPAPSGDARLCVGERTDFRRLHLLSEHRP